MKIKSYIYDSFTDKKFKGNQAAIILNADSLKEIQMKNIAKEFGYSETVFLSESKNALKKVRFFTPNSEVDLCGHATIAYIKCLFDTKILRLEEGDNTLQVETNLGILPIIVSLKKGEIVSIMMYQDDAKVEELNMYEDEILQALGLSVDNLAELKIVKAYTGLWDLMIHLKKKDSLVKINANMDKIKKISKKLDIISFHPFVLEKLENGNTVAYVKNFAPIVGIDEEAATGTSNGALAYHLYKKNYIKEGEVLTCFQGESMGRESTIMAKILREKVLVGGLAVKILEGEIEL